MKVTADFLKENRICPQCSEIFSRRAGMLRHAERQHNLFLPRLKNNRKNQRCLGCKKPMRPNHMKKEDAPGTVQLRGQGLCASCYQRYMRSLKKRPIRERRCDGCSRRTRPRGTTRHDYPNTLAYASGGLCQSCWSLKNIYSAEYTADITPISGAEASATRALVARRFSGVEYETLIQMLGVEEKT